MTESDCAACYLFLMPRVWVAIVLMTFVSLPVAHADRIGIQARQLQNSGNYKIRLSAVVSLAKTRDPRAIEAISYALTRDGSTTIRRVAAVSLGKMIDTSVSRRIRRRGISALELARDNDSDRRVRVNASRALKQLAVLKRIGNQPRHFVTVGSARDNTRRLPRKLKRSMRQLLRYSIRTGVRKFSQSWPSGKLPTRAELRAAGTTAFAVRPIVDVLRVRRNGASVEVKCSVKVRVGLWEGRDGKERWVANKTARASGSGMVTGRNSSHGIAQSQTRCVLAVLEQITTKQVVPFLRRQ